MAIDVLRTSGSSSTTRMVAVRASLGMAASGSPSCAMGSDDRGRKIETCVPRPTSLAIETEPPDCLREAVDLAQAETGPLADLLGGEERLVDARQRLRRHAATAVRDA